MADAQVWEAVTAIRALLELVPTSPGGPCRLDTCVAWVREIVESDTYMSPDAADAAEGCPPLMDERVSGVTPRPADPPPADDTRTAASRPAFTAVPFPYEPDASGESL